jgi:hypothetical protein
VSAEEHVAVATYLLAGLTGLLAMVTGVSAGFLWAQLRAVRHDAQAVEQRERRQATMQFFADTLDIRRTMLLELPEDRDRAGVSRLIQRVQGDSEEAQRDRALSTSTWPGGSSRQAPSRTRCRSSTPVCSSFSRVAD